MNRERILSTVVIVAVVAFVPGCTAGWLDVDSNTSSGGASNASSTDASAGSTGGSAQGDAGGGEGQAELPTTSMQRLTSRQYRNAVRDLLPFDEVPDLQLPKDNEQGSIVSNATAKIRRSQSRYYFAASEKLAGRAVEKFEKLTGCNSSPSRACISAFIRRFGRSVFRRPLTEDEEKRFMSFYKKQARRRGPKSAVELLVAALLQSPQFLYRPERGVTEGDRLVPLDDFEVAARLSFLLWNSVPDEKLLDAAAAGELSTPDQIERHARRLLSAPRAREATTEFVMDWLDLDHISDLPDEKYSQKMKSSMRAQVRAYIRAVLWENDGRLQDLFTAQYTYVDEQLADIYEVDVQGGGFHRISLTDDAQRRGILTLPGFLAVHSKATPTVFLGEFIQRHLLCNTIPAPPDKFKNPPTFEKGDSARERARARMKHEQCGTCHKMMEGTGLTFDRFDGFGRLRSSDEHGNPLKNEGQVKLGWQQDLKSVSGPPQLASTLVGSEQFEACTAKALYTRIEGTEAKRSGLPPLDTIRRVLEETEGGFKEQLVALVKTRAFRTKVP